MNHQLSRREWLATSTAAAVSGASFGIARAAAPLQAKPVAAIITRYEKILHADVLVGKILEGWKQDQGPGPALKLASMYVDQFGDKDLARGLAMKYNVPIFDTIEKAITVGGNSIPVDGVISIGEHGSYPYNDKGQHLYPRRRFFKGITDTFRKYDRVVPVFNDKHLGPVWKDAKWMYDRVKELEIPFMAGSSLPVSFRDPDIEVPMNAEIEAAVGIGYSGLDIYGFHALDCYQCLVERRRDGEAGVESVQCLQGDAMWKAVDEFVPEELLTAALAVVPQNDAVELRDEEGSALFLFQYRDGFTGTVLMLPKYAGAIAVAVKIQGEKPIAARFEERWQPAIPHFAYLLKGFERMVHTGRPSYPAERTVLTSGILDGALTSRFQDEAKLLTPELGIEYHPVEYPHAPHIDLMADPRMPLS